jgi:hypothetical protein
MKPNSNRPDDLVKFFGSQDISTKNGDEIPPVAAIEDRLVSTISSHNAFEIDEEGIHIKWDYLDQAKALIYRINVYDTLPEFVIFTEHVPEKLGQKLDGLSKVMKYKVITNAVQRIYESVDPEYFHANGIYGKIRWRFAS